MVNDTNTTDPFPEARDIEIVTGVLGAACSFVVIVIILVERVQSTPVRPVPWPGRTRISRHQILAEAMAHPPRSPSSSSHKKQKHIISESLVLSLAIADLMQVLERSRSLRCQSPRDMNVAAL
jgi:hypothetical protein